ncbi:MAG: MBL fold metallo-hydrolase [SAR324 cluster bacterium]|nr:MBL fold metallo-hydrolase [SAR324 cluster bacterium]
MVSIIKRKVLDGVYWIDIPEADLRILCGCPADSIKHLSSKGLLQIVKVDGFEFESGPNAILLSDELIQNGSLSNISEFVAYHMFYTQGMILPFHPNFKKPKPLMIGIKEQVDAQMEYIYRGNYGLTREKEFFACGETPTFAAENIAMKLRFAQSNFSHTSEMIEPVYLNREKIELRNDVHIKRVEHNIFILFYKGKSVQVNLNLKKYRHYQPSFLLPRTTIPKSYFSVTHTGEGDGWNPKKPSLSSVIQYDGRFFLVDAGPYIIKILKAVGITPDQLSGIFVTHVHDDHFAGLFDLIDLDQPLTIYTTPIIRSTVIKKLAALLSVTEKEVTKYFNFSDLKRNTWNNHYGMEIKPLPTAHPVDTTIYIFRVKGQERYYTYGHFSDIAALSWLKTMITDGENEIGISKEYYESVKANFNLVLDLKKIDVGGPTIHGDAEDFADDKSERLILGHTHAPFTKRQLAIGNEVKFGQVDTLIQKKP